MGNILRKLHKRMVEELSPEEWQAHLTRMNSQGSGVHTSVSLKPVTDEKVYMEEENSSLAFKTWK